jgi:hypothetical protein
LVATALLNVVQEHFQERDQTPNKNRFPNRTHFWSKLALGSHARGTESEAIVTLPYPVRQKIYGGTIRPSGGRKFLAIPVNALAYGRLARSFKNLVFRRAGKGSSASAVLVAIGTTGKGAKKANRPVGEVMYQLVAKVTQAPDPDTLPSDQQLLDAAYGALNENADAILEVI